MLSAINFIILFSSRPYPLCTRRNSRKRSPGGHAVSCNLHCRWPITVVKIRRFPSGIRNTGAFPACIGDQPIAEGTEDSIMGTKVFCLHRNDSGISWNDVFRGWSPVIVSSKRYTISEHFHWIITSESCVDICNNKKLWGYGLLFLFCFFFFGSYFIQKAYWPSFSGTQLWFLYSTRQRVKTFIAILAGQEVSCLTTPHEKKSQNL